MPSQPIMISMTNDESNEKMRKIHDKFSMPVYSKAQVGFV